MSQPVRADAGPSTRLRLAALSIGQVVSWGILYYAMIVAAPEVARETGWPLVAITAAFSAGLVVSALAGVVAGRLLDQRGPRVVMTVGSAVGASGLVVVALAPNLIVFASGWLVCGLAQAAVLYQAAFTVITRRYGERRHTPLTVLTLAGGFASTVFAPIVAVLLTALDWRSTFLVLAAVLAAITIPLHWATLERSWPQADEHHPHPEHTVSSVIRTRRFWMLEITMIALTVALFSATLAAVPLYMEKGLTFEFAALALGLIGAGQVVGRVLFLVLPHGTRPWVPVALVCALAAITLALLAVVPGPPWLLVLIGVVAGAVRGAQTLVQASAVADRWGTRNYGSINGAFAAPITIAAALTPAIGPAVAAGAGSFAAMAAIMAGLASVAAFTARAT
ncbi:MFS transporter [Agromyces ramosus]|uniref:MFS family permease n=1 Tax=Agromyces ramosus TaxID=33879 RepID=A0ABU0R8R7_9MICO|nr:MFS transporter [Agromyces ramosus]MDQ0894157.1 MFS family permease [Agromyces ramosus]